MTDAEREAKAKEEAAANKELEKAKQQAEQEAANRKRIQADRDQTLQANRQLAADLAAANAERDELARKQKAEEDINNALPELDIEKADVGDVVQAANTTTGELAKLNAKIAQLEADKVTAAEEQRRADAKASHDAVLNDLCTDFENEFGKGLRNEAIAMMNERDQTEGEPTSAAKAVMRLRDCFRQAKAKREKDPPPKVSETDLLDSQGNPRLVAPEIKEGSLEEVAAQYAKAAGI